MATQQIENENGTGITTLISGILSDGQELIKQQLQLFSVELKNDLKQTRNATIPLIAGSLVAAVGLMFLFVTAALWIEWQWRETIPMWGAFGIVTLLFLVVGGILLFLGKNQFDAFNPLPDKTLEGLKENVQWKTKN